MNETQGPNLSSGRVDGQVGAVQRVFPLALVVVAVMLVVFGTYDVATAGVVAAEVAGGGPLPFEPYDAVGIEAAEPMAGVFLPFEPYAAPAAMAGRVEAAESLAGVFLPYEPYANLTARAAGTEGAGFVVDVFLPFERGSALEPCC